MFRFLIVLLALSINITFAQISDPQEKFLLPSNLTESSGIILLDGKIITHNDSGGQSELYEIDTTSGLLTRTIKIDNATNVDWEDIAQDEKSIYIGDFGNNNGNRTNLKIYKIDKSEYQNSTNVTAEVIEFSYSDQEIFESDPENTEWDSEALISFDDNLILISKNWVDGITKAYAIPKDAGSYSVEPLPTRLNADGLVTGAIFNSETGKIYLVGYNQFLQPFIFSCKNFTGNDIFSGENTKTQLSSLGFEQAEAITHVEANRYFISSESFSIGPVSRQARLLTFTSNDPILSIKDNVRVDISLFPNPVSSALNIHGENFKLVEIYDANSRLILNDKIKNIDVSGLKSGFYFAEITLVDNSIVIRSFIKL